MRLGQRRRRHVERGELLGEVLDPRRVGPLVHAVERRQLARLQAAGDGLVGRDHQVLDQLVRLGLLARHDAGDVPLAREVELRLDGLDRERPARRARGLVERGGDARARPRAARPTAPPRARRRARMRSTCG